MVDIKLFLSCIDIFAKFASLIEIKSILASSQKNIAPNAQ